MRKFISVVLLLILLMQAVGALAYPFLPTEGVVRVNAFLREKPSTSSRAILTVPQNTTVIILDIVNEWMYVQHGKSKGYIRGDLFYDTTKRESGVTTAGQNQGSQKMSAWLPSVLLRYGMRGDAVKQLQEALLTLGFDALTVDGVFSENTESMVKAFQQNYGLASDGIVGEKTRAVLEDALSFYHQTNR